MMSVEKLLLSLDNNVLTTQRAVSFPYREDYVIFSVHLTWVVKFFIAIIWVLYATLLF